ncbi:redox-sensitive transcriptional activator SoxR [Glutamicibacter sp. JL.03c]|uniref:redox-sensitive transcriptional activator SoxR n=1 Tax=Glutamicibacter sp. JL.03c TaxID=2984842 RepID=UPI0021F7DE70|nr:redox-sensitive transcriptional activator SoxR [Glutamicibacter sp. JL.03c]UYQ76193.1 redox-sensitive transcriptional activator SoxR [Glutamicibacter sp. JL.03c]
MIRISNDAEKPQEKPAEELLSIGQVSERTGVARSALHYYEELGLIASLRTSGNQRRYPRHLLRRISLITVGRQLGIALSDIKEALAPVPMDRLPSEEDWLRATAHWKLVLEARRRAIEELEDRLMGCIGCGCLSMQACNLLNPDDRLSRQGAGARRLDSDESSE